MTGIQAARAAAEIRDELGEEVELENGHYGEFKVFVDGREVVSAGALAFLGVLPSVDDVRDAVAAALPGSEG
ncbi:MAG TPA: selenocysteine-containing [Gemmatimonadaceae bacterium]